MIVSFVLDPSAIPKGAIDDVLRWNLERILKGVLLNGVVLDTPDGSIERELSRLIDALAPDCKVHDIRTLWTEIVKGRSRFIVRCPAILVDASLGCGDIGRACGVAKALAADAVICGDRNREAISSTVESSAEVVSIGEYLDSSVEARRERYLKPSMPFDQLSEREHDDLLGRAVRYAEELVFYDQIIGQGKGLPRFKKGIEYIVCIWLKRSVRKSAKPRVRIVTKAPEDGRGSPVAELEETGKKINAVLCQPMSVSLEVSVKLEVKHDPDNVFHARHLEAAGRAFNFDRGFDLFRPKNSKELKRSFVWQVWDAFGHLKEIGRLVTVYQAASEPTRH